MAKVDSTFLALLSSAIPLAADVLFSSSSGILESSSDSDSDIEEHNDDVELALFAANYSFHNRQRTKIAGFVEDVVPKYDAADFQRHFRLNRTTVEMLLQTFGPELSKKSVIGRPSYDPEKCVLVSIWTLANQESFRCIADRFGVRESHAYTMYISFCEAVAARTREYIVWPSGENMERNMFDFNHLRTQAFPGVVGCVDGSYIQVKGRKSENTSYHTRKGFRAIILQGICDSKWKFTDIFVGWPGSSHDARVCRNSPFARQIENLIPDGKHLLGDSAYPLTQHVLTPFRDNGHLTTKQKHFNKKLSSSRVVIENAFGLLKSRFRRLKYLDMIRLDRASTVVNTACILHNLCIQQNDVLDPSAISPDTDLVAIGCSENESNVGGIAKRNYIAELLYSS